MTLTASMLDRAWEAAWEYELKPLWPVVCRVAELLIGGQPVSHEVVRSLLDATGLAEE